MTSKEIRKAFLDFFASKDHKIVPSAPMVIKDDPTLMFTNAGMNQFKDIFLGIAKPVAKRVADTQKCLRVSGKHNDLEEVGKDTYHHTMFEMLGNWSFGDYFKREAIDYAWEFLTKVMNISPDRLYATVFEGYEADGLNPDDEAKKYWLDYLPANRVLYGSKKDNFWEMGDTGPCGPCSEVHIDLRSDEERKKIPGEQLVNKDHPEVIEIWNLVFIQYNRKKDGSLEPLPQKHVDTGMGFERLCMVVQGKKSNYDTDLFQPIIKEIENLTGFKYGALQETDIAIRVLSDHIRGISFAIADGQLPSNEKAGYVIRRILRRAVRYYFTFLNTKKPLLYKLVPALVDVLGEQFTELQKQQELIQKVIEEEENAFLKTLDTGLRLLDEAVSEMKKSGKKELDGETAFKLYDSFGFPPDLTELILSEQGLTFDKAGFEKNMKQQKDRSRQAVKQETDEWILLKEDDKEEFVGYDTTETDVFITKYREAKIKGKKIYHLVFNITPFYAESGGQVGDTGYIENSEEKVEIIDTKKEHNEIIHYAKKLPQNLNTKFHAVVDSRKRQLTACNHSATHLLHFALRQILGTHVEQKGSLVESKRLRFDFTHFQKLTDEEIRKVESLVNHLIRSNFQLEEFRNLPIDKAKEMGAMALFGEKYGDTVRVIKFGDSIELCGGTHVKATGEIGMFKILSETGISAGVRRIEAITALEVEKYLTSLENEMDKIKILLKAPKNQAQKVEKLIEENKLLNKKIEELQKEKIKSLKKSLKNQAEEINGIKFIGSLVEVDNADMLKQLSFDLRGEEDNFVFVAGAKINGKAMLSVMISNNLVKDRGLNASQMVRELAKEIQGGGGGQPFYATAGGKNPDGLSSAIEKAKDFIQNL